MTERSKTTRRDFLSGKAAAETMGDAIIGSAPNLPPPPRVGVEPGLHLLSVSREAMACLFEIVFDAAQYRDRTDAAVAALDLVEQLEAQLTIYRDTSEIAAINRQAAGEPVPVEERLFSLLTRAAAFSRETSSAFDITAGQLSKVWGFYRRQGKMPAASEIAEALTTVGWQRVRLDDAARTVQFSTPGLELNLGAIGKGYALDRASENLLAGGITNFLIHGGNSSVLSRGSRVSDLGSGIADLKAEESESQIPNPQSRIEKGWCVALRHPLKPSIRLAEFWLCDQALGTSGSGTQFFHHQGKRYGHIIDPRSGWPADQVLSATVVAPTAEQADALSTAFYVMGLDGSHKYCERHPEISALLITQSAAAGGIELQPINLADDRWQRLDALADS